MPYEEKTAQVADEFEQDERFEPGEPDWSFIGLVVISSAVSFLVLVFTDRVVLRDEVFSDIRFFASILAGLIAWTVVFWRGPWILRWLSKP